MLNFLILCLINTFSRRFFDYYTREEKYVSFLTEMKQLFFCFLWSIPTILLILFVINLLS